MTTREADDEEPPPEPQPASNPPAAAVPAISLSASRRDMGRRQGDLSLGWNAISIYLLLGRPDASSLPLGRELLPPCAPLLVPQPERIEAQLRGRRAETHLVGQFSVHRGVAEQHLEREAVHERGEVRRETLGVARPELAGALALSYHLGDGVAPPAFERLALAGRLVIAQSARPQLDPQRPVVVGLALH